MTRFARTGGLFLLAAIAAWAATLPIEQCEAAEQHTLTIESTPITGVDITGDRPGTTNYAATCDDQEVVNLTAPGSVTVADADYKFVRWAVDAAEQPRSQTTVQITMDSEHTAEASYNLLGDVNFDCVVNVLDMILVRNHLYADVGTGENWKYDVTGNGTINVLDMLAVRNNARNRCPE
jgi:hypothetical protein